MTVQYITTPIYYLNGAPHVGHIYTTIAADVLARYWRLTGAQVKFLTGTDEHGQKVAQAAQAAGETPQAFTDKLSALFLEMTKKINSSQDVFLRTTEKRHHEAAQALWNKLKETGQIYESTYSGWYAVQDEAYVDESEIREGKAPSGASVEWMEEASYFFRLSEWERPLLDYYEANPHAIAPIGRRNEVLSFIKGGLRDLSISRTKFTWGIAVPDAPQHVMYVWIDALTNYLTALGYPDIENEAFKTFWPEALHLIGKDILRFHAVYWPAFLMAAGLIPPKRIFAHGWWTHNGEKMSKSGDNAVDPFQLIETYGLDPIRYFLMREIAFGQDADFSEAALIQRINSDLANDLGNLVQRVLSFIYKNVDGKIPQPHELVGADREILAKATHLHGLLREDMEVQALQAYCVHIWEVIAESNRYIDSQKPWSLIKSSNAEDQLRMGTILYVLCDVIRHIAVYLQPLMPDSASKILDQLGQNIRTFDELQHTPLKTEVSLSEPIPLFPRIEKTYFF